VGASRSGEALQDILNQIQNVTMQISQIATAAEEQTATTSEITMNIQSINEVAQNANTDANANANAASMLTSLAEKLQEEVRRFKTAESELFILEIAKGDHRKFVDTVEDALLGIHQLEASKLSTHKTCRFGKWYDGEGKGMCGSLAAYRAIETPHERIHALARDAVNAFNSGDRQKAEAILLEMKGISSQIVGLLDQMEHEAKNKI
jgi:methyl-accepting chemotaxis protein